jgi:hypothetical protein
LLRLRSLDEMQQHGKERQMNKGTALVVSAIFVTMMQGCGVQSYVDDPSLSAGQNDAADDGRVELLDPCTGDVVGYRDDQTGEYEFDQANNVSVDDVETIVVDADAFDVRVDQICSDTNADGTPKMMYADKNCWIMVEETACQSVGCAGCCFGGNGRYHCYEECYDSMSC